MAIISASTTLDAATRTATEGFTIQGGAIFTINTHTRYHAGVSTLAGAVGMGTLTMTSVTGGQCVIDGQSVRMVAYYNGTGTVPNYNSIITQGAVTGVFLCLMSSLGVAPAAVGAAMPTSGFIMFKSVSGGTFMFGALTGIGASVIGSERAGFLEIVGVDTKCVIIGRAQTFKTRKQWFYPFTMTGLVTTTGVRGQQIQLPNFGGANRFYPGIWIETGVGTDAYEFWPASLVVTGSPWSTANLGTDERSKFVQCLAGGIIRIGSDGTNDIGALPVSGCRVRIPNILVGSCSGTVTAADTVPHATIGSRYYFSVTEAGAIDVDGMLGHWRMALTQASSVKLRNVALFDQFTISETATPLDIVECHNGNYTTTDSPALVLTSNFAGGSLSDCKFGRSGTISVGDYGSNVQFCNDITFSRCHFQNRTFRANAGAYPLFAGYCDNLIFNDCVAVGGSMVISGCANTTLNRIRYADSFHTVSSATNAPNGAIQLFNGTRDTILDGFGWYTTVANVHPTTCVLYMVAARGVKVRNIGAFDAKLTAGTANAMQYFCFDTGNSFDIKFQRVFFDLISWSFYIAPNTTKGVLIENCSDNTTVYKALVSAALNQIIRQFNSAGIAPGSTASIYGSSFYHHNNSATAGRLGLKFSEPTAEYAPYVTTSFTTSATGTSGFDSLQGLALINSGDYAIFEFPWTIKGIDSFQNSAPTLTTGTNMVAEFQIDTGAGWNGAWLAMNAENLSAQTVDEVAGFKFKIRVMATATSAANLLTACFVLTNSDAAAQAITYPLDSNTVTFTGLPTGCDVVVLAAGTSTVLASQDAGSGTTYSYVYSGAQSVDIGFIKAGYVPYYFRSLSLGTTDSTLPVSLTMDRNYQQE